jgi:hypothetical protein
MVWAAGLANNRHKHRTSLHMLILHLIEADHATPSLVQRYTAGALQGYKHVLVPRTHLLIPALHDGGLPLIIGHKLEPLGVGRHPKQIVALPTHDMEPACMA